ncbi:MAG: penicillin-binding protein 2 [Chromatiaceae bacterium]|nr:MAG: penicillin-binding protein 2 [Chromatiaceae bacterium]
MLASLLLLKQALLLGRATTARSRARARPWFGALGIALTLACLGILVYQATWQLAGTIRPRFIAFMQLHDRRQFNPAHWIQRGRILDHRGTVLAESREQDGGVVRVYPFGPVFAHAVGYAHPRYGATGIEALGNVALNGGLPASLSAWGDLGRQLVVGDKRPRGQDLITTLDAELQQQAVAALGQRRGAVLLMRPDDGAVLVLASNPGFDPNQIAAALAARDDPTSPLLNRATQGQYPPGSVFKVVIAAAALEAGFSGRLDCPVEGYTTSSRYPRIRDHEYYLARREGRTWGGHGRLDLATALAKSSNVFFAQLGVAQGRDGLATIAERFLFNRTLSLGDGPGAQMHTGRLPTLPERDRYGLAQAAIGQGRVLATPAHMALITAAIGNDGLAMRPRLLRAQAPEPLGQFMTATTAARLREMLRLAVSAGTGRGIDQSQLAIAGKTGTAENPAGASHAWFVGLAPAARPRLAVAVLVEHGGYGSSAAAPIARDLFLSAARLGLLD